MVKDFCTGVVVFHGAEISKIEKRFRHGGIIGEDVFIGLDGLLVLPQGGVETGEFRPNKRHPLYMSEDMPDERAARRGWNGGVLSGRAAFGRRFSAHDDEFWQS